MLHYEKLGRLSWIPTKIKLLKVFKIRNKSTVHQNQIFFSFSYSLALLPYQPFNMIYCYCVRDIQRYCSITCTRTQFKLITGKVSQPLIFQPNTYDILPTEINVKKEGKKNRCCCKLSTVLCKKRLFCLYNVNLLFFNEVICLNFEKRVYLWTPLTFRFKEKLPR